MEHNQRILILPSWYPPDGGYFFKEHSEAILSLGWDVDVLVNRVVGVRKLIQAGLGALRGSRILSENGLRVMRAVYLKIPGAEKKNIRRWSQLTLKHFSRYEKRFGPPSLILCHSVTWAGYAASLIREKSGVPYIVVEHRSFFVFSTPEARAMVKDFYLPFFEKAYRDAAMVVPVSESLTGGLKELMPWIGEKIRVIPNMIREDMFLPPDKPRTAPSGTPEPGVAASGIAASAAAEPGANASGIAASGAAASAAAEPFVFFWAGRLEHVKGVDVLVEAVRSLKEKATKDFTVRLAGKGSLRAALEEQVRQAGVSDLVVFLGRISREEIQREMQGANCFVLPSRYEAFGAVLIEAMATGLPVIATRSGGPDHIVNRECGILVDADDPASLCKAMEQLLAHYETYSQDLIRNRCMERFGHKTVLKQYDQLFRQILDQ